MTVHWGGQEQLRNNLRGGLVFVLTRSFLEGRLVSRLTGNFRKGVTCCNSTLTVGLLRNTTLPLRFITMQFSMALKWLIGVISFHIFSLIRIFFPIEIPSMVRRTPPFKMPSTIRKISLIRISYPINVASLVRIGSLIKIASGTLPWIASVWLLFSVIFIIVSS